VAVCDVVVIGSYPPMPGPGTAATLGAVRRAWSEGASVAMVSYRTGAAPLVVPVAGPLAGRRLAQVRRHFGAPPRVSLGVQAGVPFSDPRPWARWATAAGLALAMRRFERAEVVFGEDPGIGALPMAFLAWGAGRISAPDQALADRLVKRYWLRGGRVAVDTVEPFPALPPGRGPGAGDGLFDPAARPGLVYVDPPSTTTAQRARARFERRLPGFVRRLKVPGRARRLLRR
jgi:hypothetical protein